MNFYNHILSHKMKIIHCWIMPGIPVQFYCILLFSATKAWASNYHAWEVCLVEGGILNCQLWERKCGRHTDFAKYVTSIHCKSIAGLQSWKLENIWLNFRWEVSKIFAVMMSSRCHGKKGMSGFFTFRLCDLSIFVHSVFWLVDFLISRSPFHRVGVKVGRSDLSFIKAGVCQFS